MLSYLIEKSRRWITILDIQAAIKGDKKAYENLIESHKQYLYHIAIAILNNDDDAGDAISETIVKAFHNLSKLKHPEYFKTWITRILINESKKILKQKKKVLSIEEYKEAIQSEESSLSKEESMDLKQAIQSLDNKHKHVVLLYYYNDLSIQDIAQILAIPQGTVKTRLNRARKQLYFVLSQERRYKNEGK